MQHFNMLQKRMAEEKLPFRDPSLPFQERVRDLVSRLTIEEKAAQMLHGAKAIERLGIPEYNYWNECLHGVARAGRATVFPQAIGMAATFDAELLERVATAISDEARAKHHEAARNGNRGWYRGLTFWTPNVNIFRDPRWGRGQETYGEDPYLSGLLGSAFVRGLQGQDPKYLKAAACAKHFAVHSGPEALRHEFDAKASAKDMAETYFPAFEALVNEGVEAVMGAYNRVNGEACCGSKTLLVDTLREQWGFSGHVVSDCWAIRDFHEHHKVTSTPAESAALALKMGCDLNCGCIYHHLLEAVEKGLITEADIDRSVSRLLMTRMKLGLFDEETDVPFAKIGLEVVGCEQHRQLAREVAGKSIVLLKNHDNTLPIASDLNKIVLVGPGAGNVDVLLGNYFGISSSLVTIVEGIAAQASEKTTVDYAMGTTLNHPNANPIDWVSGMAGGADLTIAVMGLSPLLEGEEGEALASANRGDKQDLKLPDNQLDLLRRLHDKGAKTVLVLTGGSPMDLSDVEPLVQAIVLVWYPGEQGGNAVADVLFGKTNPSGRLPVTFARSVEQLPPYENYEMKGRTYRYMEDEPMYPFGFGLSYTTFAYQGIELTKSSLASGEDAEVKVSVANTGSSAGDEIVQLYLHHEDAPARVPLEELAGIQRVHLQPGESKTVTFVIRSTQLCIVDDAGRRVHAPGAVRLTAAGSSPAQRGLACGAAPSVVKHLTLV